MIGIVSKLALTALIAPLALGACATTNRIAPVTVARAETVAWSVGPCFGFCPVYSVELSNSGTVRFDGERHTATLGKQTRELGPAAYRTTADALAEFRPAAGTTAQTTCDRRISDQSTTRIVWTSADGAVTTLEHDRGCRSERNDRLNATLQSLPAKLGIEAWTQQLTRPGASRG